MNKFEKDTFNLNSNMTIDHISTEYDWLENDKVLGWIFVWNIRILGWLFIGFNRVSIFISMSNIIDFLNKRNFSINVGFQNLKIINQ